MKATIIQYDPATGKGKYRTEYGKEVGYRYTDLLHQKLIPAGSRVEIKKGVIIPAKTFWQKFKELMFKEVW